tara:strand:- start:256 stop:441 length:186 start_codon:yes stop_codon:yes gene_type:complete
MIKLELDVKQAASVRCALFREQNGYTLDPVSCPQRIIDIRDIIVNIDNQIEEELKNETADS